VTWQIRLNGRPWRERDGIPWLTTGPIVVLVESQIDLRDLTRPRAKAQASIETDTPSPLIPAAIEQETES